MAGNKKIFNREIFIHDAKEIFSDYNYSQVGEISNKIENVIIICPKHGEFKRNYNTLVKEYNGCPKCRKKIKWNTDLAKKKVIEIHNGKYDTSKLIYKNTKTKFTLTCPEHGEFLIDLEHILRHQGCPKCRYVKSKK